MHIQNPLISVCIPLYNGEKYLSECLESVKKQTYTNFEIIIVDDMSSDDSVKIAEELLADFQNKRIYKNEKNLGLVGNWERCISLAKGDWIKFIFQDDIMLSECLELLIKKAIANNVEFSLCSRKFLFESCVPKRIVDEYENVLVKPGMFLPTKETIQPNDITKKIAPFITQNVIGEPVCWLFHKNIFNKVGGFNKKLKLFVDYEFALKIIMNHNFVFIRESLIYFRVHNNSTSMKEGNNDKKNLYTESQIRGQYGDIMELVNQYMTNNLFIPMKKYWGVQNLKIYFLYTYFRICKLEGEKRSKMILNDIVLSSPFRANAKYNRLKYEYYKRHYKKKLISMINRFDAAPHVI